MNKEGWIYKKIDLKGLGERIRKLRGNESQDSFAEKFGVSQADISRLERGTIINPSPELLFNICISVIPPVDFKWLLTGEDGPYLEKATLARPQDPKVASLIEKLERIFKDGNIESRARVRGTIEEVYDQVVESEKKTSELEAQKRGA